MVILFKGKMSLTESLYSFDQSMEWEEADWNQDIAPTPLRTVVANTSCLLYDHLYARSS